MDAMDFTSYCDITSLFITKTIDRIISPMAVQLCHLVIALECDGSKYNGASCDFEQMAEELSRSTEHFAKTSIRLGEECDDGILRQEMEEAAKDLLITGNNILLSVQKLCIQPNVRKHQENLITAAQNILTGTLKILQLEDDAGVRKINEAVNWLLECLHYLQKAESIPHLLTHFCEFSEALLLVNNLIERRIIDIKDTSHQHNLSEMLQTLRKCVPMLYTATKSNIKHPHNEQMLSSKLYIFDLASKTLQELKCLLKNGPAKQDLNKKQGSFSHGMSRLLKLLSTSNLREINSSDLDFLVGAVVFYSMYVADCSRQNIKLRLVTHCRHLLEKRQKLCDYLNTLQESSGLENMNCHLQKQCAFMKAELSDLSQLLVSTIFYQILDAFSVKDPLKRLLKCALKTNKKATSYPQNLIASKSFQLLRAFQNHTEHLLKISSLVLAQCSQEKNLEEIQSSVDFLCRVRDEVVEFIIDNNMPCYESKMFEKAQYFYQKWIQATQSLMVSFDSMLTVHQFLELSIKEIQENRHHCEKLIRSQEPELFQHHGADLCDLAERLCQVINRHVDQSKDPIFRNGLRVLVRQLERGVLETREAILNCVESISCVVTHTFFVEKMNKLFECIHSVKEGVFGCNHPELLSPLRAEVVPVGQKPMIIDLNELDQVKEDNFEDPRKTTLLLSYKGYLSKPLPSATSQRDLLNNTVSTEKQNSNLQPLIVDLLLAVKKLNMKEISVYSSTLIEISSIYLEEIKECLTQGNLTEKDIHRYKEVESLLFSLAQLTKEGETNSVYMGRLIQTAVLLSHCIEEIKIQLVSFASFWYSFSQQLFCSSPNSDVGSNVQIFNQIMQRLSAIMQSLSEYLLCSQDDLEFPTFSEKQGFLVQIHVKFSKCQAIANRLLTKILCFKIQPDTQNLEDICIQWSVAVQQLSKCVDDFIGIDHLIISESRDLAELKFSECKSFLYLCEASLWLQEACALSVKMSTEDNDQKTVGLLKEEVDILTESVLKVRKELNEPTSATKPATFLNIECALLQKELMFKAKLLMYHIKIMYNGKHTLLQKMLHLALSKSTDKSLIEGTFENDAKLLASNITLLKDTLCTTLCLEKKKDVAFLVDHLFFLTGDIISRSRLLMDNHSNWEMFMLNAMALNWLAKADQLVSHLQCDEEIDAVTLVFIKDCLETCERVENKVVLTPTVLENVKSDKEIQSVTMNIMAAKETEQKCSSCGKQNESNEHHNAIYEQITSCRDDNSEINNIDKVKVENRLQYPQPNTLIRKEWMELNKEPKSTVRKSTKAFDTLQEIESQAKQDTLFIQEQSKLISVPLKQTSSTKSDENLSVCEINIEHLEITEHKTLKETEINNVTATQGNETPQGVPKEMASKESRNIKRQILPGGEQKEATNFHLKIRRAYIKCDGMQKQTSNQESKKQKTFTQKQTIQKEATNQELSNHGVYYENATIQKDASDKESRNQITITESKKTPTKATNQKSSNKGANAENITILKVHSESMELPLEVEESSWCKMLIVVPGGQEETNHLSKNQKAHPECSKVPTKMTNEESLKQRTHEITAGNREEKVDQGKNHEQQHIPVILFKDHKEMASQVQTNVKNQLEFVEVQTKIAKSNSLAQKTHSMLPGEHNETIHEELHPLKKTRIQESICPKMVRTEQSKKYFKGLPCGKISLKKLTMTNQESNAQKTHPTVSNVTMNKEGKLSKAESLFTCWKKEITNEKMLISSKETQKERDRQISTTYKTHKKYNRDPKNVKVQSLKIEEIDGEKPLLIPAEDLRNTSVIVEHQKINLTSLENIPSQPRRVTTCLLAAEVETWEGENNKIVKVTREMAAQMSYMIQYLNRKGPIQTPEQFIASAKSLAALAQTFVKFVGIMAKNCMDERNTSDLLCGMEQIETISNQLNIVSSVKAATGCDDYSAEDVLLKNAQNLIHSILATWKAAEAACIKSSENPVYSEEEAEVAIFCSQLRNKLVCQRAKESSDFKE